VSLRFGLSLGCVLVEFGLRIQGFKFRGQSVEYRVQGSGLGVRV